MNSWLRHPLRVTGRLLWMAVELFRAALLFFLRVRRSSETRQQSRWLQQSAERLSRIINIETQVSGCLPTSGLLVSNHLGYVDILVLASLNPSVFVSKADVRHWPVFGWFARRAGTVFVHRDRKIQTREANSEIETVLKTGALVVLFPEGTSSDGKTVLSFKSSLLQPAANVKYPLSVCFIEYELDDGDPGEDVAYWGEMVLVPHLINLLSKRRVRAKVRFAPVEQAGADRKELAIRLRDEVFKLRNIGPDAGRV